MCIHNTGHVHYIFGVNSVSSLLHARDFCRTFCIVHSDNRHALLEQLLRRVSDNTALRYIAVLWQLFTTVKDLELEISSLSQVQLVDAIHTLQRSRSRHASLHSLNVLKAIRWFASTVQPDGFPSLYQGLFHSKAWQSSSMRKEAIPLPLAFVLWLETELIFERLSRSEAVFAGSVLLCIWCSLRFSDAQHVRLEQFFIDFDSIRSISYRTKSRKFMPFGCISGGLYRLPSNHSWLFHWLSAMEHTLDLNSSSAAAPDYIFFGLDGASVRLLSYAEALVRLRRMLDMWGGITSLQTLQYTLHSMKVTLLAFFRQLDFSLETRHLQGHHTFAASSTLYGRDDVSPLIIAQDSFIAKVLQGWRARTPMMRGVTFMPSEPPLVWAQEIGSVASIPALAFFRFSEERDRPTAVASPLAGESDQLHSAPVLASPPALPEVPRLLHWKARLVLAAARTLALQRRSLSSVRSPPTFCMRGLQVARLAAAGGLFVRSRTRPQFHVSAGLELAAAFSLTWTERSSILKRGDPFLRC